MAVPQPRGDGLLTLEIRRTYASDQCSVQSCYREATAVHHTEGLVVPLCYAHEQTIVAWSTESSTNGHRNGWK